MATRDTMRLLVVGAEAQTDDVLDGYLALAAVRLDVTEWGTAYTQATALLAGHLMQRVLGTGAGAGSVAPGNIMSEKAGGLARSYGSVAGSTSDAALLTTQAGAEFVALRDSTILGARVLTLSG